MTTTYAPSPKAIAYAQSLLAQCGADEAAVATVVKLTAKQVSNIIDLYKPLAAEKALEAAKAAQPTTALPAGKYAVEVKGATVLVKIDKPEKGKWAGWTFVKTIDGDTETPARGAAKTLLLTAIEEAGRLLSVKLYGKVTGHCGICGRELTDPKSIDAGIGPVCAAKF